MSGFIDMKIITSLVRDICLFTTFCSGEWDRTTDLQVMSLTSCRCSTPRCFLRLSLLEGELNALIAPRRGFKPLTFYTLAS